MTLILNGTDNSATTPAVTGTDTDTGVYYPAANQVALATNGTLALIVDASQRVGLGVTPHSWQTDIKNPLEFVTGAVYTYKPNSTQNDIGIVSNSYYDGNWRYSYSSNGANAYYMTSDATAGNYRHVFRVAPSGTANAVITWTDALAIQDTGGVRAINTISVGNATPASTGTGITFPATQSASSDANTLDDYEEGTWTPTIFLGATSNSIGTATGTYTKIGNVVFFACRAENITKAGTGNLTMGSLPFTASSAGNQNRYAQCVVRWTGINSGGVIIALAGVGTTTIEFQNFTTTGGYSGAVTDSGISASYSVYGVSGFYYTS